jgi:hypothetical protein
VALEELRALLKRAGVLAAAQSVSSELSPADAQRIIATLAKTIPSLVAYGPRKVVLHLMREVVAEGKSVFLGAIARHVRRFKPLVIVRPDGYLAGALDGRALQRAGRIQVERDAVRAGELEVGSFYFKYLGNLFRVDGDLQCTGNIESELALEHGLGAVDSALDGVEDALGGMAAGIAQFIREPVRSLQALRELPAAVAALIENSPEYWQRFRAMPANDQIREVSRIISTLLLLYGSATGATARLTGAAGKLGNLTVQTLRLTGNGELALATVSVPVGQIATALGGGPGAVYILHMANTSLPKGGSGEATERPTKAPYQGRRGEEIDPEIVQVYRGGTKIEVRPNDVRMNPGTNQVEITHGISLDTDPNTLARFGGVYRVRKIPPDLRIIQRGQRPTHFEIVPREPMPLERYRELLGQVELE